MAESDLSHGSECIEVLYRLIRGSIPLEGGGIEVEMCQRLIESRHARQVALAEKPVAIATLDGVSVFRRFYNSLNLADAIERHQRALDAQ